jgi:hypothetical protein
VLKEAAAGKTALNLRHFYWDHGPEVRVDTLEYSRRLLDYFGRRGILIQTSAPTLGEAAALGERLHEELSG